MEKRKIVVGLSGGVDSSVTAWLLKEQGWDVLGVTMNIWFLDEEENPAIADARKVAEHIGIPHYVLDCREEFRKEIVGDFMEEYLHGRTPNPCVLCNRVMKWEALMKKGRELGAEYIATGHYAYIRHLDNGRYTIEMAKTGKKDQTYALCNLTQEQLAHTVMPLGAYEKEEVREMAKKANLPVAAKPDSQDICFIKDNDYAGFIEREAPTRVPAPGNFVSTSGEILGTHKGIIHYTVGQRKGLNLAMGHPVFVTKVDPQTNEVVIGENEDIFSHTLYAERVNLMSIAQIPKEGISVIGKIRYAHSGDVCHISWEDEGKGILKCVFEEPQRAITPGQTVVFYEGSKVAACGRIL